MSEVGEMDTEQIDQLSRTLQALITIGLGMRIVYIFIKLTHEEDEAARYKKRLRNTFIFAVLAQIPFVVRSILVSYLG